MTSYRVLGMTCEGCAAAVTRAIRGVAPDAEVRVDLARNAVDVAGFDDAAAIGGAVEDAGFEFAGPAT